MNHIIKGEINMIDFLISAFATATLLLLGIPFAIGCDTLLHNSYFNCRVSSFIK